MAESFPQWTSGADVNEWVRENFGSWNALRKQLAAYSNEKLRTLHDIGGTKEGGYPRRIRKEIMSVIHARQGVEGLADKVKPSSEPTPPSKATKARKEPATRKPAKVTQPVESLKSMTAAELRERLQEVMGREADAIESELTRRGKPI